MDYIGVGVGAMIFNEEGKVFLAKRGEKARNEKFSWEFPGGCVKVGEKLNEAVRREFLEEYGIEVTPIEFLCVTDHILKIEKQHWVSPAFIGIILNGMPIIMEPEKCIEIGWFSLDNLPTPLMTVSANNAIEYNKRYGKKPYNEVLKEKGKANEV